MTDDNMRWRLINWGLTLIATVAATAVRAQSGRERDSRFIVRIGDEAPTFQFVTNEGDTIDSDMLRGQVVVLQFAASWCPFSQAQLVDHQKRIWERYRHGGNFAMYVICEDSEADRSIFIAQRKENGIDIPYTFDSDECHYRLFVTPKGSVTRTVVISPEWRIAELHDIHTWRDMSEIRRCVRKLSKLNSKFAGKKQKEAANSKIWRL